MRLKLTINKYFILNRVIIPFTLACNICKLPLILFVITKRLLHMELKNTKGKKLSKAKS